MRSLRIGRRVSHLPSPSIDIDLPPPPVSDHDETETASIASMSDGIDRQDAIDDDDSNADDTRS